MRQHALIGALIVMGAGAQAAPVPLGEDDLKTAVAGKTVSIDTPFGLPLTVNYGANGIMTGTAGTALAVYLGSAKDRGRWHIRNGKLCQKWFKWLSSEMTCLTLAQDGLKVYWRSDEGRTGTATIEPGPPVIEGATASGLGLPPQPVGVQQALAAEPQPPQEPVIHKAPPPDVAPEPRAHAHAVPPLPVPGPPRPGAHTAPMPARREAARPKPAIAMVTARPVSIRASLVREPSLPPKPAEAMPPAKDTAADAARPAVEHSEPTVARFAVAGLMAMRLPTLPAAPITARPLPADPFAAGREPLRQAAEHVTQGVLEHRWCLGNAFARGPSRPIDMVADGSAQEPELVHAPSLLAIAQEATYEGELPLYDAACLTEQPAIGMVARVIERAE